MANTPNDDVLDQIFRACPIPSLAVISLVSSRIRTLALPHLLRTVSLDRNPQELLGFLNFVINNTQSREAEDPRVGPEAEVFGVDGERNPAFAGHEEYPISTILTRALALLPNLQSITIEDCVEEIVSHASDFALTVLSRPRLNYIDLGNVGPLASNHFGQALNLTKSFLKLKTIKLDVQEMEERLELIPSKGMGSILFHSRGDLTDLFLETWDLRSMLHHGTLKKCSDNIKGPVIFPKVVTLALSDCDVSLKDLASAFPALRTLEFSVLPFSHDVAPQQTPTICFPNLISIQGRYKDLEAFFQSTIGHAHLRRVVVDNAWFPNRDAIPFAVTRALPALKVLHFTHMEIMPSLWWEAFVHTAPHLTYLAISLFPRLIVEDALDILCIQVPRILASAPIAYFSLSLQGSAFSVCDTASPGSQSLEPDEAIALSYATNICTLKYIDIYKETEIYTGATSWWRVVRSTLSGDEVNVQVESLDQCDGTAMKSWYDLEA